MMAAPPLDRHPVTGLYGTAAPPDRSIPAAVHHYEELLRLADQEKTDAETVFREHIASRIYPGGLPELRRAAGYFKRQAEAQAAKDAARAEGKKEPRDHRTLGKLPSITDTIEDRLARLTRESAEAANYGGGRHSNSRGRKSDTSHMDDAYRDYEDGNLLWPAPDDQLARLAAMCVRVQAALDLLKRQAATTAPDSRVLMAIAKALVSAGQTLGVSGKADGGLTYMIAKNAEILDERLAAGEIGDQRIELTDPSLATFAYAPIDFAALQ